jgi:hypothetical protein
MYPGVLDPTSTVGLPPYELTIAALLKAKGYATAMAGKSNPLTVVVFCLARYNYPSYSIPLRLPGLFPEVD